MPYQPLASVAGFVHVCGHRGHSVAAPENTIPALEATITGLKSLNLDYTQVSDAGLVHLRSLKTLEILELEGTRIVGPGLAALHDLQRLETLDLRRPIYRKTAAFGHFGRIEPEFTWERTDKAAALRADAGL